MTFTAKFTGTESTSGVGIFTIGEWKWQIRFPDAFAFNATCALIEAATHEGERKAVREFVSKVREWAGEKS
ncbi:hypothetical protein [Paraburkholderia sp. RL18-085-BIA-A]|uniref:hypothetical protein n=1 Tax=Paraburkholderia sp. RL18-085-BIA-A TaxID=3031633 RepID=UPI0038BBE1FB